MTQDGTPRPPVPVGARVRAHRTARGWSMRELARRAGVSQPFITKLERGDQLPSIPTLYDLAAALEVLPSALLPDVHPGGEVSRGVAMPSPPQGPTTRLLAGGPDRTLHVYEVLLPPGGDEDWFTHPGEEVAVVLQGRVVCERRPVGRGRPRDPSATTVGPEGSLVIDPTRPHRWRNPGDTPARLLLVCDDRTAEHAPRA